MESSRKLMDTLFVTGTAGYIASIVSEYLIEDGLNIIGIDNFQESSRDAVNIDMIFYEGDYGDKKLLEKIFSHNRVNCVLHFAAETTINLSMTEPGKYFHNNVVNGITLLNTMRKYNCKNMIFSSTAAVYGEPEYVPIDENHPKRPINSYGESKLMFETVLDWYARAYGIKYNLFRYFNAAGATDRLGENREHETHLLPLIYKAIFDNEFTLKVYGNDYETKDGTCIRDYLHVSDIAEAHILGMKNLVSNPKGKYNLGSSEGFSVLEIIKMVEYVTSEKVKWKFSERRNGDPAVLVASNSLARKELNWNPINSSLEQIISDSYRWFKKLYNNQT